MSDRTAKGREFTGRHMLAIMFAFFGVIIAVNGVMATFATRSWSGLVVENTYVASQQFNERAAEGRAQAALGWKGTLDIGVAGVSYSLVDASGAPVSVKGVVVRFRHPAYEAADRTLVLERMADNAFATSETVRDGIWIVEVDADTGAEKPFRDVRRMTVADGTVK